MLPRLLAASLLIAAAACDQSSKTPPSPSPSPTVVATPPGVTPTTTKLRPIDPPSVRGTSPNLVTTPGGIWMTWLEPLGESRASHRLRLSKLDGAAWSAPTTITEGPNIVANWADVPSVAAQTNGTLVTHWAEKAKSPIAHAYDIVLARSTDDGKTWRRLGMPHRDGTAAEHGFVSLLPDGDSVLAIWLDGRASANGGGGPTMLRTAQIGETIGPENVLEERVWDCCSTSATITSDGPVVAYRDRDGRELRDPYVVRRTERGWSAPSAVHHDGWRIAGCPVNGPTVVANGDEVVTAWYTYAAQRATVRIAFSSDGGASFASPIEIDGPAGARAPIGRVDVVIDRPGEAIVSWTASERDVGQLLVRRVSRDGRRGPELAVASTAAGREAGLPRMELLGGDLLIAWTDPSAQNVRAVRLARHEVAAVAAEQPTVAQPALKQLAIGSAAPDYGASLLDGTAATLSALRGHPDLVNVWATWCEPCRHELPVLAVVQKKNRDRGLRVVALSVDREATRDKIAALAGRLAPGLEVWHDPQDSAASALGVAMVPTTLLFDAAGVLRWRREGAVVDGDKDLSTAIEHVLAK